MTLYYQRKTCSEYIYLEENITCLNLMDKYFPTQQLHLNNINLGNLNKDISVLSLLPQNNQKRSRL